MDGVVSKTAWSPAIGDLWEYLLVVHPDASVNEKVKEVKQDFFDQYHQQVAIKTQPQITLANFLARESMEDTVIRWIQRVCSQQKSFTVMLNNYSGFPPHTIYLRIQDQQPFRHLAMQLKPIDQYVRSNGCPGVRFISRPHLTIAKKLQENIYNKAMLDYSQKDFYEVFMVNELVLLKRLNQFDRCRQVNVFGLYPPDTHMQTRMA